MKNRKLPSLIALSISLELVLSPLPAMAQNNNVLNTINQSLNLANTTYNAFRGNQGQMPPHVAIDMASLKKQQTPTPDKHFTLANMQKIPGLMEYIAKKNQDAGQSGGKAINPLSLNCTTLPTTLYETNTEVCRNRQVNTMAGDPKAQADEAFAYYNQYLQVAKLYDNYSVKRNDDGPTFGIGCMEDAMEVLKGFFAYRAEQLDVVTANLESMIEGPGGFIEQTEQDLTAIRESSAILNGEKSNFASEFKDSQIFDYGKRFEDPACNSLLSKDGMNELGSSGLLGIEKKLKSDLNSPAPGSKYSPDQYIKNNVDIVADIQKMASKVAEQANLNFSSFATDKKGYSEFLGTIQGDISTDSGANVALNKGFFSDLQTKFAKTSNKLRDEENLLKSELGGVSGPALSELGNIETDANFEAEITSMENRIKSNCVSKSGVGSALSNIYDPTLSKSANKHSSEQIKKKIKSFIDDDSLSSDQKLEKLQQLEVQGGSRYEMKMDADYKSTFVKADGSTDTKTVNAAKKLTPSSYFTDVINNCEAQFRVNKMGNKLSGLEAVKKLRALKQDYKKVAAQHSQDIKSEITKKMIDCGGNNAVASSSAVGSCTTAQFNMESAGFCTKAAFSCATNMKRCTEKAQKFVTDIKADRTQRRDRYNQNVEATRKKLVGIFDSSLGKYMKEAESLRGMFGTGFTPPTDVERDIKNGKQFMSEAPYSPADAGDKLDLKDPKIYLAMVKDNIKKLKKSVEDQQEAILGNNGPLSKHIENTENNYKTQVIAKTKAIERDCLAAYNSYKTMLEADKKAATDRLAEKQKMIGELGQKEVAFCNSYNDVMKNHVVASCDDAIGSVSDSMIKAASISAQQTGDYYTVSEANRMLSEMQIYCNQPGNQRNKDGASTTDAAKICSLAEKKKDPIALEALKGISGYTPGQVIDGKVPLEKAQVTAEIDYLKKVKDLKKEKKNQESAVQDLANKKTELAAATDKPAYQLRVDNAQTKLDGIIANIENMEEEQDKLKKAWDDATRKFSDYEPTTGPAATGGICEFLRTSCQERSTSRNNQGDTSTSIIDTCTPIKEQIVANYDVLKQDGGSIGADTTSGDAAAFCNAGNNSGPYNTKDWMNQGQQNNPMDNGGAGTVR